MAIYVVVSRLVVLNICCAKEIPGGLGTDPRVIYLEPQKILRLGFPVSSFENYGYK